jgi:hypothetical protein
MEMIMDRALGGMELPGAGATDIEWAAFERTHRDVGTSGCKLLKEILLPTMRSGVRERDVGVCRR